MASTTTQFDPGTAGVLGEAAQNLSVNPAVNDSEPNHTAIARACTLCTKPAQLCCTGCDAQGLLIEGCRSKTWYCGVGCQKEHWKSHKAYCKQIKGKIDEACLRRAVKLLEALYTQCRRISYDLSIASARREGDVLYVKEGDYNLAKDILPGFDHVEALCNLGPDDHAMILSMLSCGDPIFQLFDCCDILLRGTNLAKSIQEIDFTTKPGPRSWVFERSWETETTGTFHHEVFRIGLKDGTFWALDLTAPQYGYNEVLQPWEEYTKKRVRKVDKVQYFGHGLDAWYPEHVPSIDPTEEMICMTFQTPTEIARAIGWCQYQISKVMQPSIQTSLEIKGISARQLLRTLSEKDYEEVSRFIVCEAREAMQGLKDRHGNALAFVNGSSISSELKAVAMREDVHGTKHIYIRR